MVAFNGSGTYNLPAGNPVVTGTTITSGWANSTLSDVAVALTNCITRDGQSPATNNIPFGGFRLVNVGQPLNNGEALIFGGNATLSSLALSTALPSGSGGTGLSTPGTANNLLVSTGTAWASKTVTLPVKTRAGTTSNVTFAFA